MRILQVIPFFTPQMGGSAQVAYQISQHLARRGHQVTVLTSDYAIHASRFPAGGFEVIFLPNMIARWGFYLTPGLVSWVKKELPGYEIIHMHTVRTFQNAVVAHYAKQYHIPYFLSAHGTLPVMVQRQLAKRVYDLLFGCKLLVNASRLVAVSKMEQDQYVSAGVPQEKIALVPNGLDIEEFAHLPERGRFRQRLELAPQAKIILFLGRIHQIKGIDTLLEAFRQSAQCMEEAYLVIAGPDDGDLSRLQQMAFGAGLGERVLFPGPLYGDEKLAALVDANVLASPAMYEIFGLVPFEAIMCGTPVVVSQEGGVGQVVGEAQCGYLVPYEDEQALAAAIDRAIADKIDAFQKVCAGQTYVRERLDWRKISIKVEHLYQEALQ